MTIICPSCQATYRISPETLGEGRPVRCSRCRTEWFATSTTGSPAASASGSLEPIHSLDDVVPIDAIDIPNAVALDAQMFPATGRAASRGWFGRRKASPGASRDQQQRRRVFKLRPAAAIAACGIVALGALVGGRTDVVRAAPSLASLYAVVGLPVNVRGLTIGEVKTVERIEEGVPLLLVSGVVSNISGDAIEVPRLRLAVTGEQDRELYAWTTVASRARLAAGESAPFRARLASPPADGRGLTARFVAQKDLAARPPH